MNQCGKVGFRLIKEGKKKEGADYMAKKCFDGNETRRGETCSQASDTLYELGELKASFLLSKHSCFELNYGNSCYSGGETSEDDEIKLKFYLKGCELGHCFSCSEAAEIYIKKEEYLESVPFAEKSCLGECKMSCEAYSRYNILRESGDKE